MTTEQQVLATLALIREHMQTLDLWEDQPPSAQALQSQQPFCVDTLSFSQWSQFILIPRLEALIASGQPLPSNSDIFSMAQEAYRPVAKPTGSLEALFLQLDRLLRDAPH